MTETLGERLTGAMKRMGSFLGSDQVQKVKSEFVADIMAIYAEVSSQAAEIERLRAIVDLLPLGVPIGVNDRLGNPIHIGDKLDFDHREWGGPQQFVVELKDGTIQHPGCTSDLSSWCEIIESWDAREVSE